MSESSEEVRDASSYGGATGALSAEAFLSLGSMEGLYESIVAVERPAAVEEQPRLWLGYAAAAAVAACAYGMHYLPFAPFTVRGDATARHPLSVTMIAIVLGLVVCNALALPASIRAGCKHVIKKVIPLAIVCTGAGLDFGHLVSIGPRVLLITVVCVGLALAAGYYLGRLFGLRTKAALLLGVGTGICGNSAIVAVAPLIDAEDEDVFLSVGAINFFGFLAMLAWPILGAGWGLSDERFGVWSGTSIHAVPQAVAAGFAYSPQAGTLATLVKLVRVALLAPVVFVLAMISARGGASRRNEPRLRVHYLRLVPWFVWGFVALALLNTLGAIPTLNFHLADFLGGGGAPVSLSAGAFLTTVGKILLTLALAAIGLEVNVRHLMTVGARVLGAGLASTIALGASSAALIMLLI